MGRIRIEFRAELNAERAKRFFLETPDDLDDAVRRFVLRATMDLAERVDQIIETIAGGVYWDVKPQVANMPSGAIGRVTTPPSRPHPIDPHGPYPLRFKIDGRWISTYHVEHPGSHPVEWHQGLGGFQERAERILEAEAARVLGF